jgi:hypothetical protein
MGYESYLRKRRISVSSRCSSTCYPVASSRRFQFSFTDFSLVYRSALRRYFQGHSPWENPMPLLLCSEYRNWSVIRRDQVFRYKKNTQRMLDNNRFFQKIYFKLRKKDKTFLVDKPRNNFSLKPIVSFFLFWIRNLRIFCLLICKRWISNVIIYLRIF